MFRSGWKIVVLAGAALIGAAAQAQTAAPPICERTRAEVRSECVEFLKTHRWDESAGDYVLKSTGKPAAVAKMPEGLKSRQEILAERNAFLKANRWNEASAQWEPLGAKPRDLSKLSRDEVRKETAAFVRTHKWDEMNGAYVPLKGK